MSPTTFSSNQDLLTYLKSTKITEKWVGSKSEAHLVWQSYKMPPQAPFWPTDKKSGNRHWGHTGCGDCEHILEKYPRWVVPRLAGWPSIISESIPRNRIGRPHLPCVYKYIGGASRSNGNVETDLKTLQECVWTVQGQFSRAFYGSHSSQATKISWRKIRIVNCPR